MKLGQLIIGFGFLCLHKWLNLGVRHPFCYVHVDNVVDGSNLENFIKVIMNAYLKNGGLIKEDLFKKLLCLDANGVNVFKGKTKVTKYTKEFQTPFSMGVHCVTHKINLVT